MVRKIIFFSAKRKVEFKLTGSDSCVVEDRTEQEGLSNQGIAPQDK